MLVACGKSAKSSTSTTSMPVIPQTTVAATGGGKVCTDIAAGLNASVKFAETDASPDAMRQQVQAAQKANTRLLAEAPASIKADVDELVAVSNQLFSDLEKVNYDIAGLAPGTEASLATPQLTSRDDPPRHLPQDRLRHKSRALTTRPTGGYRFVSLEDTSPVPDRLQSTPQGYTERSSDWPSTATSSAGSVASIA